MSNSQFAPSGNGRAIATSITSASIALPASNGICVTNRSNFSAWITWSTAPTSAVFPTPGDPAGSPGMEIPPQAQVTIGTTYADTYLAAILLDDGSGNPVVGVLTIVPGDGL